MGRRRSNPILQLDFFGLTDHVTLGTKPIYVIQEDGTAPPYAEVISSRVHRRQPRPLDTPIPRRRGPIIFPSQPGKKWCSVCGDWTEKGNFSPKMDTFDKLHPYCKPCRARHARRIYWSAKETAVKAA